MRMRLTPYVLIRMIYLTSLEPFRKNRSDRPGDGMGCSKMFIDDSGSKGVECLAGEKIMVVDDEAVVREILTHYLHKDGFQVISTGDGYSAMTLIRKDKPDLILLDILLPELDGLEVCQVIRRETDVPVIFITSKGETMDVALGLGVGGDDYIRKPFDPIEVVVRVKAHLRRYRQLRVYRSNREQKQVLDYPGLKIDLLKRSVEVNGSFVTLTAKEFDILTLLAKNPNQFFSSDQLIKSVWGSSESADQRSLMVHISKLRKKIEEDPSNPKYIITVRNVGYRFFAP